MIHQQLDRISSRLLVMIAAGGLVIITLFAYTQVFKPKIVEFDRLKELRSESEREVAVDQDGASEQRIRLLKDDIASLKAQLHGKGDVTPPGELISYIIGQLDQLSVRHSVDLVAVTPGDRREILSFSEVPFDVEVRGDYFRLYDWLEEAEVELRPMVVKQFNIEPDGDGPELLMNMRVVSYRSADQPT